MFTLLNELHFWTFKNDITIRDSDFGSFRYYDKKGNGEEFLYGKKSYTEKRGIVWSPSNKRPTRLKDSIRELEELLDTVRVLCVQWKASNYLQVVFNSGIVVHLKVNQHTGDIASALLDKSITGKLLSDYVSDAAVGRQQAVFSYADNQVSILEAGDRNNRWQSSHVFRLAGPSGRRLGRRLSLNTTQDKLLVWWKATRDEVYPWSPVVRDQDRANVHIYSLTSCSMELSCFYRTDYDPALVAFSAVHSNLLHSIQQSISSKGEVVLYWKQVEVNRGKLSWTEEHSVRLHHHVSSLALSPTEDRLLIGCVDGTLLVTDTSCNVIVSAKSSFIPGRLIWEPEGCLVVVSNERGQVQFYDASLVCIKAQLVSEDVIPSNIIDVGAYFSRHQPTLLNMYWSKKPDASSSSFQTDGFLLLHFERGPLAVLRVLGGNQLSVETLTGHMLSSGSLERALGLLGSLDWDVKGATALACLQALARYLLSKPLNSHREVLLQRALACYYTPRKPFTQAIESEFGDSVHDISRKVFHHFLRYQVVEKAFRLAIDLNDYDLFMDLHNYCKTVGNTSLAEAALEKAEELSECSSSRSGSSRSCCSSSSSGSSSHSGSTCSLSNCSQCAASESPPPTRHNKVKFSNTVTHITLPSLDDLTNSGTEEGNYNVVGLPDPNLNYSYPFESKYHHVPINDDMKTPLTDSSGNCSTEENGKIKVVHFGLV